MENSDIPSSVFLRAVHVMNNGTFREWATKRSLGDENVFLYTPAVDPACFVSTAINASFSFASHAVSPAIRFCVFARDGMFCASRHDCEQKYTFFGCQCSSRTVSIWKPPGLEMSI